MRELEALLKLHDDDIEFDHLNNRIRCYPHIINICSSHIIASSTHISKRFLETLKSEFAGDLVYSNIEGDEDDEDDEDGEAVVVHTLVHLGTVLLGLLSVMQHR
jgi:hypothetical protein